MNFSTTGCWCCFLHSGPYTVAFVTYRHGWQHSRAQEANAAAVMNWVKFNTVDPSCLKVSETVANYTSHIVHISLMHLIKKTTDAIAFHFCKLWSDALCLYNLTFFEVVSIPRSSIPRSSIPRSSFLRTSFQRSQRMY